MPPKLLESFSGKLAERWVATLFTPAFIFWAGGLAAFCNRYGIQLLIDWFTQYAEPLQIAIVAVVLVSIVMTSFVAKRFDIAVLRGLEGYWFPGLRRLLPIFTYYQKRRRRYLIKNLKSLQLKVTEHSATALERAKFVRCDRALSQIPKQEYDLLPTHLGNILRAAERYPYDRYGLDAVVCWPRLWLLLPLTTKQELQAAQSNLNSAVRLFLWSFLFLIWGIWAWWVVPLALLAATFAYQWSLESAEVYGELIEATFDIHRQLLYQALRWYIPDDPDEERRVGKQLNSYLWRGKV